MQVPWGLLQYDYHRKLQAMVRELNRLYRAFPAFYQVDYHHSGFEWVDFHDADSSIIAFSVVVRTAKTACCSGATSLPCHGQDTGSEWTSPVSMRRSSTRIQRHSEARIWVMGALSAPVLSRA